MKKIPQQIRKIWPLDRSCRGNRSMLQDDRRSDWRRSVLLFFFGLLLATLWSVDFGLAQSKRTTSANATAQPHTTMPAIPAFKPTLEEIARAEYQAEVKLAGNALGFLHTIGIPAFIVLGVLIIWGITTIQCENFSEEGPILVSVLGAALVAFVISNLLWRHAYVPAVDTLWQACGGRLVPYSLEPPSRSRRRIGSVSDYTNGKNAALLTIFFGIVIAAQFSKAAKVAETDPRSL